MEIKYKDDYTCPGVDGRLKIIREIQIDSKSHVDYIMRMLGDLFKIYQYNTTDRKDYDLFSWTSEDGRTATITYNENNGVMGAVSMMMKAIAKIEKLNQEIELNANIWVKLNDIETDLIRKIKKDVDFEESLRGESENELD